MADDLQLTATTREARYLEVIPQIRSLIETESDPVANMANVAAALKEAMEVLWVGFYIVRGSELVLGPFQGPVACTRIQKRRGVCGTAWARRATLIVGDVDRFPGHIACSSLSRSELVIPVIRNEEVVAVFDADSERKNDFSVRDEFYIKQVLELLTFL